MKSRYNRIKQFSSITVRSNFHYRSDPEIGPGGCIMMKQSRSWSKNVFSENPSVIPRSVGEGGLRREDWEGSYPSRSHTIFGEFSSDNLFAMVRSTVWRRAAVRYPTGIRVSNIEVGVSDVGGGRGSKPYPARPHINQENRLSIKKLAITTGTRKGARRPPRVTPTLTIVLKIMHWNKHQQRRNFSDTETSF